MDYFPNIDAVRNFTATIWPVLRQHLPQLTLTIVGARPTPEVQALAAVAGITVTGTVPDVRPFYANALAAIVPLRTGGGTRLKILEAMAAGTPVISTELGAEGLAVDSGKHILLAAADSAPSWLHHIESLLRSPDRAAQLTMVARQLVETRYDWSLIGARLANQYSAWLDESK
jgi:glycosyltransferase involved in cell wall biosynthesis